MLSPLPLPLSNSSHRALEENPPNQLKNIAQVFCEDEEAEREKDGDKYGQDALLGPNSHHRSICQNFLSTNNRVTYFYMYKTASVTRLKFYQLSHKLRDAVKNVLAEFVR